MQQKQLNSVASLVDAGMKISAGAAAHAPGLGLVVATKPFVDAEVEALKSAKAAHESAKGQLRDRMDELKVAVRQGREVALLTRDLLRRTLGQLYSSAWDGTGFQGSLKVPTSVAKLANTLRSLKDYLADHPELEKENVATIAIIESVLTPLTQSATAATVQRGAVRTLIAARRAKEKQLRLRISGTVNELTRVLGPLDGRWEAFGLNQPGLEAVPEVPEPVKIVANTGGKVTFNWERAERAVHYRLWLKVVDQDEEPKLVGSVAGLTHTVEKLAPGAQVEVALSASNSGGESRRNQMITLSVA